MKRDHKPDLRLDWRDPDMPVLRLNANRRMIEVDPDWITQYYANKLSNPNYNAPQYKNDPTYDLKKSRKNLK